MKAYLITFRSITYAQRGEQIFSREGLRCHLRRTPRWMEQQGCGYAVEVKLPELEMGRALLRREGVPFRKAYRMNGEGSVGEEIL